MIIMNRYTVDLLKIIFWGIKNCIINTSPVNSSNNNAPKLHQSAEFVALKTPSTSRKTTII